MENTILYPTDAPQIITAEGYDEHGNHVADYVVCNKDNCNCEGGWVEGFNDRVVEWVDVNWEWEN